MAGTSIKKAKFHLCKMVLKEVFDIKNTYELEPENMTDEYKTNGHPAEVLHRLVSDIKFDVTEEINMDGSRTKTFTSTAYVNGFSYSAQGEF